MNRKTLEVWVGLFVAAGLLALGMLAFKVANLTTADVDDAYRVKARFENIGGLRVKAAVTLAGVRVGRVSAIEIDAKKYQAVVTLDVDGRYAAIPKDSTASILTSGLLGDQYIGIEPGGDDEFMKAGDTFRLTQSAVVLEKLIGQFLFSQASGSGNNKTK
jgi:phospholipid/cholesterol/gamma-HCH transport system substrate-binding protein